MTIHGANMKIELMLGNDDKSSGIAATINRLTTTSTTHNNNIKMGFE